MHFLNVNRINLGNTDHIFIERDWNDNQNLSKERQTRFRTGKGRQRIDEKDRTRDVRWFPVAYFFTQKNWNIVEKEIDEQGPQERDVDQWLGSLTFDANVTGL